MSPYNLFLTRHLQCIELNLVLGELAAYAELFKENHITGKRLFLVTMDDLLQIGMFSVGHRRELLVGGVTGVWVCYMRCGCHTGVKA